MEETDINVSDSTPSRNRGNIIDIMSSSAITPGKFVGGTEIENAAGPALSSEQAEKHQQHLQDLEARCTAREDQIEEVRFATRLLKMMEGG